MLPVIELMDAIVDDLNAHSFSETLSSERTWDAQKIPSAIETATAIILPAELQDLVLVTRKYDSTDFKVAVALQKLLPDDGLTEVDKMIVLGTEILDYMKIKTYDTVAGSPSVLSRTWRTLYDKGALDNKIYQGFLEIEFHLEGF